LRQLGDKLVELTELESISTKTARRQLDDNELAPWRHKMWCIQHFDLEYVARMEDVLDLYTQPPDPRRPVVCIDETPRQFIGEARVPAEARPETTKRYNYEYKRNGTANLLSSSIAIAPGGTSASPTIAQTRTLPSRCASSPTSTTQTQTSSES